MAVQYMADMLAADPSLKVRAAARKAVAGMAGNPKTNADGARRRYITLQKQGKLPKAQTSALFLERRIAEVDALYEFRDSTIQKSRRTLIEAELKAQSRGLDLSGDLTSALKVLESARERLEPLARSSSEYAFSTLLHRGISRKDAAILISQAVDQDRVLEEDIAILRQVRHLRSSIPPDE